MLEAFYITNDIALRENENFQCHGNTCSSFMVPEIELVVYVW